MVRRLLASVFLAAFPVVVIPIAVTSMGARAGAALQPQSSSARMVAGRRSLTHRGRLLNQGQCISYFIHHPVSLADLAGSFFGTTSVGGGTVVCSFVEQLFDATYPGSSAVGSVTLHLDGCFNCPASFTYTGIFAIATSVGTLVGNANGPVSSTLLSLPRFPTTS